MTKLDGARTHLTMSGVGMVTLRDSTECGEMFRAAERLGRDAARTRPPLIETIADDANVKIERFLVRGLTSPPDEYADEPSHEVIILLKGRLVLEYAGRDEKVTLKPGDYAVKGSDEKTRADAIAEDEETEWIKVSYRTSGGSYPDFTGFGERDYSSSS